MRLPQSPALHSLLRSLQSRALLLALMGGVTACSPTRYRAYYIPSESMLPTFEVNDRILVDRAIYQSSPPQRGDIVIFRPSEQLIQMLQAAMPINPQTVFVKRVIGLPGEVLEVKQGQVYVNQLPLSEPYLSAAATYQWGPITVPPQSVILLGDNRNNAFDSHYWGALPQQNLLGRVIWRYWPLERFGAVQSGYDQSNLSQAKPN